MSVQAYPLQWPSGWKRTAADRHERARFGVEKSSRFSAGSAWCTRERLTIAEAVARVRTELQRMGIPDWNTVISSNLTLRLDGLPRSGQSEPADPGVAVYWRDSSEPVAPQRCMAVDRYDRCADNLAAVAATLAAMRAIERHGGAEILHRAFTGFAALTDESSDSWWIVLGVASDAGRAEIDAAYQRARSRAHPDHGGSAATFARVQRAYEESQR